MLTTIQRIQHSGRERFNHREGNFIVDKKWDRKNSTGEFLRYSRAIYTLQYFRKTNQKSETNITTYQPKDKENRTTYDVITKEMKSQRGEHRKVTIKQWEHNKNIIR